MAQTQRQSSPASRRTSAGRTTQAKKAPAKAQSARGSRRELDLVVYGATGFVGVLVSEYLAANAPTGVKIALAGRSQDKLTQLRDSLGQAAADWPVIVADAADDDALHAMAARTTAVVTTVGPYLRYGMPLVAACAANGTHYADLTGESLFARQCADQFELLARETGARIVNSCGFDSIPSDLGVFNAYTFAQDHGLGELTDTTLVVKSIKGGFSGGTIDSMRVMAETFAADPSLRDLVSDPYVLTADAAREPRGQSGPDTVLVKYDRDLGGWMGPFVMAEHNTRVVRRTNSLLGWVYGPRFSYREVVSFGQSPVAPVMAVGMGIGMQAAWRGMSNSLTRPLLDRALPKPGEGPSAEARAAGKFVVEVHAKTSTGATVTSTVAAKGDPGYQATSVMLAEAGLSLALDGGQLPPASGVLTPASAMGDCLNQRLRAAGFRIEQSC